MAPKTRENDKGTRSDSEENYVVIESIKDVQFDKNGVAIIDKPYVEMSTALLQEMMQYYPVSIHGFNVQSRNLQTAEEIFRKFPETLSSLRKIETSEDRDEILNNLAQVYKSINQEEDHTDNDLKFSGRYTELFEIRDSTSTGMKRRIADAQAPNRPID